jgi:gas vesicle protein
MAGWPLLPTDFFTLTNGNVDYYFRLKDKNKLSDTVWRTVREEEKMETNGYSFNGLFKGFLMGSFLGAAAGILFAPKSGKELRSDIKEKGEKALKDTKEFYSDTKAKAEFFCGSAKHRFWPGREEKATSHNIESPEEFFGEA